jgi:aryl-alcohol dehydrogenase-like predicted oxidoreductase
MESRISSFPIVPTRPGRAISKTMKVTLGRTGLGVSPVGFGGYRVHSRFAAHHEALELALSTGCNLIDTSANYTDGGSETLIGETLAKLFEEGRLKRDEIVVVTKAGYVQGANYELAQKRIEQNRPFPEMVKLQPGLWHCISPEFLEDQITRSLERLKLDRIDVLLLHNPEYFLKAEGDHPEYYRRIREAFAYLEGDPRIRWYGISSNTFADPKESPEYTSLETVLEIAQEISPRNRFGVIQFPFNLFEPGAVLEHNNSSKTVSELAALQGIGTLINRPLNSFTDRKLIRLADFRSAGIDHALGEFQQAMSDAMEIESRYQATSVVPLREVAWGHTLKKNLEHLSDLENWKAILSRQIAPDLEAALATLTEKGHSDWARRYQPAANRLFDGFTRFLEAKAATISEDIKRTLDEAAPELRISRTLSQKAIRLYRSFPGIDCVLVGMRKLEYVRDALEAGPPIATERAFDALEAVLSKINTEEA